MKLSSIRLHPFAGIQDQKYAFGKGMNVLLGPNEVGKSTVFQALMRGLLTTTSLTRTKVNDEMGSYFPAIGGDVIHVDLKLTDGNGETVHIHKVWKKGNRNGRASLKLAGGTEITDEEDVQKRIEALLPVSPATLRTIMFGNQSGLHRTIKEMEQAGRVRKELGNLLRKNFMETGGVSMDRFKELPEQKYETYFKRWDRNQQYPENNRGTKKRYKVGTGAVVEAFYKKEQLRVDLEEARRFEDELDTLNEQKLAQNKVKAEQLEQRIDKIEQLSKKVEEAQKEIKDTKAVTQQDLKTLRKLKSNISHLKTQIKAAKLTLHIESDSEHSIRYSEAGGEDHEVQAKSGTPIDQTAEGGFTLKTKGLSIQVFSGEGDLEQAVKEEIFEMKQERTRLETEAPKHYPKSCKSFWKMQKRSLSK